MRNRLRSRGAPARPVGPDSLEDLAADAWGIAQAAIRSADPGEAIGRTIRRTGNRLRVGNRTLRIEPDAVVRVVAIGKAAAAMIDAARKVAAPAEGIAFSPQGYRRPARGVPVVVGNHPVPGPASFVAGGRLLDHARKISADDVVLFLLSGGGSATVEVPAPPVRPEDIRRTVAVLLASGVPLGAMNSIRRHLSLLKGGQLAKVCPARRFATVVISDVVGDVPTDIASGPTVADPTTYRDALDVVRRFRLTRRLPRRVVEHLRSGARGELAETPKPGDPRLDRAPFALAATNRQALEAARAEALRRGFRTEVVARPLVGETRNAAERFVRDLLTPVRRDRPLRPLALIAGGETTVTLGPRPGRGGRNSEFAVAAARQLRGRNAVVLSVGTDGVDGPTDAAGGWVDGGSYDRTAGLGLDPQQALASHNTYALLERLGNLVRTGPTGTNVTDVHVGVRGTPPRRVRSKRPRGGTFPGAERANAESLAFSPGTGGSSPRRAARTSRHRPS